MATNKENLEERIERIRRQTEEIEKKHREAEADRLMALNQNAMVKLNQPLNDDWPKAHKYDKIDFMYDAPASLPGKKTEENQIIIDDAKSKRIYKKFPEGEGPPPDPVYNFLADDERGDEARKFDKKNPKEKAFNNNFKSKDQFKRGQQNGNTRSGRSQLQPAQKAQQKQLTNEQRLLKNNSQIEQWRSNDGKDKFMMNPDDNSSFNKKSPKHTTAINNKNYTNNGNNGNIFLNNKTNDCMIEKRGNITVSISQTGEVKSVKLTSAPAIGTGRVGPRQISKPQFHVIDNETLYQNNTNHQTQPTEMNSGTQRSQNYKNNNQSLTLLKSSATQKQPKDSIIPSNPQKSQGKDKRDHYNNSKKILSINVSQDVRSPELVFEPVNDSIKIPLSKPERNITNKILQQSSESEDQYIPEVLAVVADKLSNKPEFKKSSVQDRLLKIREQKIDHINDLDNNCNDTTKNKAVSCN